MFFAVALLSRTCFYMFTAPYGLATRTLSLTGMFHRHEGLMILRITYIPVG